MVTLVASAKGDPFCRPKIPCNMAKKGAKHFVLGLATKQSKMVEKIILHLQDKFGFFDPK